MIIYFSNHKVKQINQNWPIQYGKAWIVQFIIRIPVIRLYFSIRKLAERTARKDLEMLEQLGILRQIGQKRGAYYVLKDAE